jgi:hypothetical protein
LVSLVTTLIAKTWIIWKKSKKIFVSNLPFISQKEGISTITPQLSPLLSNAVWNL